MTSPSRRTVLGGTASLIALSAGCLSDGAGNDSTGNGNGNGNGDGDGDEGTPDETEDLPDGLAGYDTHAYQTPERSTSPAAELLQEHESAANWVDERDEMPESVSEFVDETDFETSILIPLWAGAPDPCHELALESIDIGTGDSDENDDGNESDDGDGGDDEDTLVLEAAVRETAEEDEACMARETTVGRVVRATFEEEPLTSLSISIVDRNGDEHGIGMASDSSSASASQSRSTDS